MSRCTNTDSNASPPDTTISNNDNAFNTGVDPCFNRSNIAIVRGASDPTSIKVVLKFSNDIKNATIPAPTKAVSGTEWSLSKGLHAGTRQDLRPPLEADVKFAQAG